MKIGINGVAVKGSKARHNDAMHLQLPGTIGFQTPPSCDGEVSGGTIRNVKINGKEVAVIGSTVTTCNDIGVRENSRIVTAGAWMGMQVIINPLKKEEYEAEREGDERKERKFNAVKWEAVSVGEGAEVALSAKVENIADGNTVTFFADFF